MTLLKEILQLNESITFDLDVASGDVKKAVKTAKSLGAKAEAFDTNANDPGLEITVTNKDMGNKVIDAIYGDTKKMNRDSNAFYMGLED